MHDAASTVSVENSRMYLYFFSMHLYAACNIAIEASVPDFMSMDE